MIDTVRVAELNNELGVVQDTIQRAELRAGEIVAELRALLVTQPDPGRGALVSDPAGDEHPDPASQPEQGSLSVSTAASVGTPAPASLTCPKCGRDGFRRANGLAMHTKHCDGIGTQRIRVQPLGPAVEEPRRSERPTIRERIAARDAGRNPRSAPPLDLAPRLDLVVGE